MTQPTICAESLEEIAQHQEDTHAYLARELPVFINGYGPFLIRRAPLRLVPLPMRTAYALVLASLSKKITFPSYSPGQDWVVRATSNACYGY